MALRPAAGFRWEAVSWGGPDEPVSDDCSYCGDAIGEDDIPLRLWTQDGWGAAFCDACQTRWWGLESFDTVEPRLEPEVRRRAPRTGA
jgi:hypothetical protein